MPAEFMKVYFNFAGKHQNILLPLNARNIVIRKLAPSKSRVQLIDSKTNQNVLLNFDVGEFNIGDVIGIIEKPAKNREDIFISGPLTTEIQIQLDFSRKHPASISYKYVMMNEKTEKREETTSEKSVTDSKELDKPVKDETSVRQSTKNEKTEKLEKTETGLEKPRKETYQWEHLVPDECDARCDGGIQRTPAVSQTYFMKKISIEKLHKFNSIIQ